MTEEINLGTFCFQGRYFSATMSMHDDEGNVIPFNAAIQSESMLKLYREAIEKMLMAHENDPEITIPQYINDDGVKYVEGIREHHSIELQNKWDTLFAPQSDRVRFQKISRPNVAIQRVIERFQAREPFDALEKLILRYGNGITHNYRDRETVNDRIIHLQNIIDP